MWATIIPAIISAVGAIAQMSKKGPSTPSSSELSGNLSEEEESKLMASLEGRLTRRSDKDIESIRQNAASRGAFRSGQLPILEQESKAGITQGLADAQTQLTLQRARGRGEGARARYNLLSGQYQQTQSGAGQNLGLNLSNLVEMFSKK